MEHEKKAKLKLGKFTTLRDELRCEIEKAKSMAQEYSPEEIDAMANYYREANRDIYRQKKIDLSGAEIDQLLRHVPFQANEPAADFGRVEMDELDAYYRQVHQARQQSTTPDREM